MTVELSGPGLFSLARLGFDMVRLLQLPPPSYLLHLAGSLETLRRRSQVVTRHANYSTISTVWVLAYSLRCFLKNTILTSVSL